MATRRRILKELDDMAKDTTSGMHATPLDVADMTHLQGRFAGPPGTPYEGGEFVVDIKLPDNYPFMPPRMKFITKIWHPNVSSQTGAICLDTLSQKWSPVLTIKTALLSLQSLLDAPEPTDPQDAEVAQQMIKNPGAFRVKAQEWAHRFAGAPKAEAEIVDLTANPAGNIAATSSASPAGSNAAKLPRSAAPLVSEEQRRLQEYSGFPPIVIERFTPMGFPIPSIVRALEHAGVRRGRNISDMEAERIVELLLH
ncbi:ubiquitin-conjugating enzyme/RWD-like protein [Tuber indicum]|nr:ubiquitin-conjugating enzyme/RWD-like protein [Tuber indicum]